MIILLLPSSWVRARIIICITMRCRRGVKMIKIIGSIYTYKIWKFKEIMNHWILRKGPAGLRINKLTIIITFWWRLIRGVRGMWPSQRPATIPASTTTPWTSFVSSIIIHCLLYWERRWICRRVKLNILWLRIYWMGRRKSSKSSPQFRPCKKDWQKWRKLKTW